MGWGWRRSDTTRGEACTSMTTNTTTRTAESSAAAGGRGGEVGDYVYYENEGEEYALGGGERDRAYCTAMKIAVQ